MNNLSDIKSKDELASLLNIPVRKLTYILYIKHVNTYYKSFNIPKKNGGYRYINAPSGDLKKLQKKLAQELSDFYKEIINTKKIQSNISHAFEKEKGIITNAKIHRNKRFILNLDLENFFDNFHFGRVRGFFYKNNDFKFPLDIATIIAQLTCYNGKLPQGAPTSPIITNLIFNILDMKIVKISRNFHLDYTRYADDLTFSTNDKNIINKYEQFFKKIKKEINKFGFSINDSKTRVTWNNSRQVVTGLTVNKKINTKKEFYKTTRAMANSLYANGTFTIENNSGTLNQLEGRFAFIDQLDRYNNKNNKSTSLPKKPYILNSREKQYQIFLFYKYFFCNDSPLIITEGKTDIRYLQCVRQLESEPFASLKVNHLR